MNTSLAIRKARYWYLEDINETILRQFPVIRDSSKPMVLDVGCGMGGLSEAIEKRGYTVWGIELNEEAAETARRRITKVINADLTDIEFIRNEIGGNRFDYLVFADILEHLIDPWVILREYLGFLKPQGYALVSLPNVAAWTNRVKLLLGRFDYTDTGIMDRGHIRFFTFRTAKDLLNSSGCNVVKIDYIPYFVRIALPIIKKMFLRGKNVKDVDKRLLVDSPWYKWYMKYINPLEYFLGYLRKPLFAFKMIIVAKKL